MPHFGVLSYKGTGHLNPLIALSRQLMAHGNRVTFFQKPELETRVRQSGLEFFPIGGVRPSGQHGQTDTQRNSLSGIAALRYRIRRIAGDMEVSLRETPEARTRAGREARMIGEVV